MAFVAQRAGMADVGPFTFNALRFALGTVFLLPFAAARKHRRQRSGDASPSRVPTWSAVLTTGLILFGGASFQQVGMVTTTAGKAGFITGLYVVLVPLLGLFWHRPPPTLTWLGALLAAAGLYFLTVAGPLVLSVGDILVFICAFFWAGHILLIGHYSPRFDTVLLAGAQFAICSLLSLVVAVLTESISLQSVQNALIPILYAGIFSSGIGFTLQVTGQNHVPPSHAAIVMSLEAVFAVLGGWLILSERMGSYGWIGCGLMLAGMIVSQLTQGDDTTQTVTSEVASA